MGTQRCITESCSAESWLVFDTLMYTHTHHLQLTLWAGMHTHTHTISLPLKGIPGGRAQTKLQMKMPHHSGFVLFLSEP